LWLLSPQDGGLRQIWRSHNGKVIHFLSRHAASGFLFALKKFVKAKVIESNTLNQIIQEIKLHAFVNSPNIVQFYGCVSDQDNLYLILEYMEGGTLFDYLNNK
jgi:serine/threonine protein kinase